MAPSEEAFYRRLAGRSGLPFVSLRVEPPDPRAVRLVPAPLARYFRILPVAADAESVTIASSHPRPEAALAAVEGATGRPARVVVSPPAEIEEAVQRLFGPPALLRAPRYLPAEPETGPSVEELRVIAEQEELEVSELQPRDVDTGAARLLGEQLCRRFGILPLTVGRDWVRVAIAELPDTAVTALVESATGRRARFVLAPAERIAHATDHAFAGAGRLAAAELPDGRAERLGELLVATRAIDRESLRDALARQRRTGDRLGGILVSRGIISEDRLAHALARQLRISYMQADALRPTTAALAELPEHLCRAHRMLPLQIGDGTLIVALADPFDAEAAHALRAASRLPVRVVVASESAIVAALERVHAEHYVRLSTTELLRRRPEESAHRVLTRAQALVLGILAAATMVGLASALRPTLIVLTFVSTLFYFAVAVYRVALVLRTLEHAPELPVSDTEVGLLDESLLPRFTILVPLYREAAVLPGLVEAIDRLDYPKTKLDVKLLLEEDDSETLDALRGLRVGPHFQRVVVPASEPRTKPKACNYGLLHARGDYVVIYDAEDLPEPDQLKKVVVAFRKATPDVVCIQAKLNYWNADQNLLTRWFTSEYSMWFDLFLPGLDATGAPIPLGGTSTHFRLDKLLELGAWDPFNVTEDADVGIRLTRSGYRTAMVDSVTLEEANSRVYNWIRQRSRWVKGYVQTWLVHMRDPVLLWRQLGAANFLSFQLVIGGTFLTMLMNPVFWALTSLWALTEAELIREIFPGFVYFAGGANLLVGNFAFTYLNVLGALRRGKHELVKTALLSPLYWALMSVGAWKGFLQLVTRPSYWEKTVHGLTGDR
ncbi:MAG TPA: glycosyltransferase [Gaiellaceae bacterium]|jgi:cellulose synthase/poly-beta-1,6-N-acetylglucosamine synthase-like glycosyltransferase|nr:glycosyltransferase [Gaiellaceae bacterium]